MKLVTLSGIEAAIYAHFAAEETKCFGWFRHLVMHANESLRESGGAAGDQATSEYIDLPGLPGVAEHIMRKISLRKVIPQT